MKNQPAFALALLTAVCCAACGKREAAPVAASPADATVASPEIAQPAALPLQSIAPKGVPPCPDLLAIENQDGDEYSGSARLLSAKPVAEMLEFYTVQLAAEGWHVAASSRQNGEYHFQFAQGQRTLRLQLAPAATDAAATQLRMAWGAADSLPAHSAPQEPDDIDDVDIPEPPSNEW